MVALVASIKVYPSGMVLASVVAALTVPPPGRFSMTKGLPSRCPNFGASTCASLSAAACRERHHDRDSPHRIILGSHDRSRGKYAGENGENLQG